ncbi:MAG: acetyl-CoA carboxylase biotin carboxyl carrier protein [Deltaproteobacteria bacterium]|uniref:Biotin carboxyl carrier protein of acetyl-CoA carboxylase n=1 Tax=Candidatus Zymogenus saltonus TaxID=2844893 RepID=A0A9D8KF00_9DELT|nr:acetyl-CoA carboxylase biotin carboxyl carrier protein [Candidatus Zymogenus saltonus]
MNLKEIKDIIKVIDGTDISEIEIERSGERLMIKRNLGGSVEKNPSLDKPKGSVPEGSELVAVVSPLVGSFYRSPSPDSPPFVEVGSEVRKGDVLCIVESMKLNNEIEVESDGIIVSILVENGQPVEYGQSLFLLEPI